MKAFYGYSGCLFYILEPVSTYFSCYWRMLLCSSAVDLQKCWLTKLHLTFHGHGLVVIFGWTVPLSRVLSQSSFHSIRHYIGICQLNCWPPGPNGVNTNSTSEICHVQNIFWVFYGEVFLFDYSVTSFTLPFIQASWQHPGNLPKLVLVILLWALTT